MAFTRAATSDTDPKVQTRAYGSLRAPSAVTPFTAETAVVPRQAPGRSNLTFGSTNIPQPERTARDPQIAPVRPSNISGRQGPTGNPIGDAIGNAAKKVGTALAKQLEPLPTGVPGITTSDLPANTGFFSSITDAIGFTSPPRTSDFTASLGLLNEGGFVRKRT
tara:strand:+ start:36 stop:527 length:492 start_codon:yes stop_codon:yes gene_type:complete